MKRCLLLLAVLLSGPVMAELQQGIVINEVDADTPGADTREFIELYDGGTGNTPLDGYVIVLFNGYDDRSYKAIDLDGYSTDADGYFVIGSTGMGSDIEVGTGWLQNGTDAVALYSGDAADFPDDTPVTTDNLVDAVVYDTDDADDPALLVLLNSDEPQVNENGSGDKVNHSIQRSPSGSGGVRNTHTYIAATPTPGTTNVFIELTYPVGGETVQSSQTIDITWTSYGVDSVLIEGYSRTDTEWDNIAGHSIPAADGVFSIDLKAVEEDDYVLRVSDRFNSAVNDTSGFVHVNDVTFGGLGDEPFVPENGASGVPVSLWSQRLAVYFNESVQPGTGHAYLKRSSDNTVVKTFDVSDPAQVFNDPDDDDCIMFNVGMDLDYNTTYYVEIEAGAITDRAPSPNAFDGFSGSGTWSFTTEIATAVRDETGTGISIGPNPVTDKLCISAEKPVSVIQVINLAGSVVAERTGLGVNEVILPAVSLPRGLYIVKIVYADGTSLLRKVIKR